MAAGKSADGVVESATADATGERVVVATAVRDGAPAGRRHSPPGLYMIGGNPHVDYEII